MRRELFFRLLIYKHLRSFVRIRKGGKMAKSSDVAETIRIEKVFLTPLNPTNVPICCVIAFQMTLQKKQEMFLSLHKKRNSNKNKPSL